MCFEWTCDGLTSTAATAAIAKSTQDDLARDLRKHRQAMLSSNQFACEDHSTPPPFMSLVLLDIIAWSRDVFACHDVAKTLLNTSDG